LRMNVLFVAPPDTALESSTLRCDQQRDAAPEYCRKSPTFASQLKPTIPVV